MKQRIIAVFAMLAVCFCFAACGDDSTSLDLTDLLPVQNTQQDSLPESSENEDEMVMLVFKTEPKGELAKKQEKTEYKVYYSGRVKDEEEGTQKTITGAELEKLKKYAADIIDKKIESKFEGGNVDLDITVAAYTKDSKTFQLSAMDKCSIDGFDEMYKIVNDKFKG